MTSDNLRGLPVVAWRCGNMSGGWNLRKSEPRGWARSEGLVSVADYAALLAERDALRERLRAVEGDAAIGRVVWDYIDRMNDYCEQDPAERIIDDFRAAVSPAIDAAIDAQAGAGGGG